jgi:ribonuclease D
MITSGVRGNTGRSIHPGACVHARRLGARVQHASTAPDRPVVIADDESLRAFCESVRETPFLALDTEFMRVRTYYPELCLIQVASADGIACIDPLAKLRFDPLLDVLHDPAITKVMHAGRQDLELFYLLDGRLPGPLFDTQIAAALLGFDDQIGYGRLVEQLLGVTLDKAHTRTDWAERPLSAQQLAYAAEDVEHLVTLYETLRSRLAARGRLGWLEEDARALLDASLYSVQPEEMWQRVKGQAGLRTPAQHNALALLAAWREREAMSRNRPRQWILKDAQLVALARTLPASRARLAVVPDLPRFVVERYASTLLELISAARERGGGDRPPRDATDPEHVNRLAALVRERAAEHELSPALLAPRRELTQLLRGERDLAVMRGWRAELIGRDLLALVEDLARRSSGR